MYPCEDQIPHYRGMKKNRTNNPRNSAPSRVSGRMINTCHCTEQKEAPAFAASWSAWVAALHLQRCSMGTPSRAKSICLQRIVQPVSLRRIENAEGLSTPPSATDPTWFPALWTRNSMTHWFFSELKPCVNGGIYIHESNLGFTRVIVSRDWHV